MSLWESEGALLAGLVGLACFLTSLCLTTLAFWEFDSFLSCLLGLVIVFMLGVAALFTWAFVCAIVD